MGKTTLQRERIRRLRAEAFWKKLPGTGRAGRINHVLAELENESPLRKSHVQAFRMYFGLSSQPPMQPTEIAAALNVPMHRAYQMVMRALRALDLRIREDAGVRLRLQGR